MISRDSAVFGSELFLNIYSHSIETDIVHFQLISPLRSLYWQLSAILPSIQQLRITENKTQQRNIIVCVGSESPSIQPNQISGGDNSMSLIVRLSRIKYKHMYMYAAHLILCLQSTLLSASPTRSMQLWALPQVVPFSLSTV